MAQNLLLIEDDDTIADVVHLHLTDAGYRLHREADGERAIRAIDARPWDLVLLDLMLPGADGWEVCRHIRAHHGHLPIIILSARSAEAHRVLGLELGADDYLTKPFSMLELIARVRALLRRVEQLRARSPENAQLDFGSFRLDPNRRELSMDGTSVPLTLREFDLLFFLARHPGQVFSRAQLLNRVWGSTFDGFEHTVNSHINRLRSKIDGVGAHAHLIETVWGVGYRFSAAARERPE
jgi:DNA-binding response OmpR family regulator